MKKGAWSLVLCAVAAPLFAFAACPPGYTEYSLDEAKGIVVKSDDCSDEEIRIIVSGWSASVCHKVTVKRQCATETTYGCTSGQIKPKLVAIMPQAMGGKTITIHKCDKRGLSSAIDASFEASSPNPLLRYASEQARGAPISSGQALTGGDVIQRALAGTDATPAQIQTARQSQDLLTALRGGDSVEIERAAKQAGLTAEQAQRLVSEQGRLTAAEMVPAATREEALKRLAGLQTIGSGQSAWGQTPPGQRGVSSPFDCSTGSGSGSGQGAGGTLGSLGGPLGQLAQALMNGNSPFGSNLFGKKEEDKPAGAPTTTKTDADGVDTVAVATLLVQRTSLARGESMPISWSSVGMSNDLPCGIFIEAGLVRSHFGQGNEGSATLTVRTNETSSVLKVLLQCTSKSGKKIEKEQTIGIL